LGALEDSIVIQKRSCQTLRLALWAPFISAGCLTSTVFAQNASGPGPVEERGATSTDTVIISKMPERKGPVYALLKRFFCKHHSAVAGAPGSEVWAVPQGETSRMSKRLQALGMKVTKLKEDWNHVLHRHQGTLARGQQEMVDSAKATPGTVDVHIMRAHDAAMTAFAMTSGTPSPSVPAELQPPKTKQAPSRIVLPIDATTNVTLERVRYVSDENGCSWRGVVAETGESALLMRWNDGHISGVLGYKGHIYMVTGLGGELHAVVETDPRKLPPDHGKSKTTTDPRADLRPDAPMKPEEASPAPTVAPFADAERETLEGKPIVIDVMLLYTKKAASRYLRPDRLLAMAIEQANDTFRNSGLGNISLRLVHTQSVDYDESEGEHFDHLYRMVDGIAAFKDIRKLRDEKRADIVGLILEDPSGCGLSTRVAPDADEAYFVVHHSCAAITISIAHEIGHILGARHDRGFDPRNQPFAYGHGHVNGKWRDIMSYQQSCDGCVRIPYWSNPRVMYKGEPSGTPTEDNARVILEQAEKVSKFR
jgi:metallopeptidase family M12-like protein